MGGDRDLNIIAMHMLGYTILGKEVMGVCFGATMLFGGGGGGGTLKIFL